MPRGKLTDDTFHLQPSWQARPAQQSTDLFMADSVRVFTFSDPRGNTAQARLPGPLIKAVQRLQESAMRAGRKTILSRQRDSGHRSTSGHPKVSIIVNTTIRGAREVSNATSIPADLMSANAHGLLRDASWN